MKDFSGFMDECILDAWHYTLNHIFIFFYITWPHYYHYSLHVSYKWAPSVALRAWSHSIIAGFSCTLFYALQKERRVPKAFVGLLPPHENTYLKEIHWR